MFFQIGSALGFAITLACLSVACVVSHHHLLIQWILAKTGLRVYILPSLHVRALTRAWKSRTLSKRGLSRFGWG